MPGWKNPRSKRLPPDWQRRRKRVLRRDNHECRLQFDGLCTYLATEVDHIKGGDDHSYANLQSVCAECHRHKTYHLDRPRRARPKPQHPGLTDGDD